MKKFVCENCGEILTKWRTDIVCESCGYVNERLYYKDKKSRILKRLLIVLSVILVIVGLCVWDIEIDPPAFWRTERIQDKRAILAYVTEKYPDAVQTGRGKFPLPKPAAPHQASIMYFSLDGIDFHISAEYGKVVEDVYSKRRAESQFNAIIQDKFLKPRGIDAEVRYYFSGDYDVYPYTEWVGITLKVCNQGRSPQEVGWLYDFYNFWKEEGEFLSGYGVTIEIWEYIPPKGRKMGEWKLWYSLYYADITKDGKPVIYSTEEAFYNAFELGYS
ncbi:MAG: hypothetical protein J1F04_07070 [Oscillospiraceae bacterium]|nr:hypothetical protein [Oscillospiraceae bacterium]